MAHQAERVAAVRSWLYTAGTQPQRFDRAAAAGADGLIIDLEDSVPVRDKDTARANAVAQLAVPSAAGVLQAVRINPPATRAGLRDLEALAGAGGRLDAVVVPKCESPAVLGMVASIFAEAGAAPAMIALVETGTGSPRSASWRPHRIWLPSPSVPPTCRRIWAAHPPRSCWRSSAGCWSSTPPERGCP